MTTPDELRAAMRSAQVSGKGQYIEEGRHVLDVDKALVKRTTIDGNTKESWIIEFKVIESSNSTHEVGSTRSYVENPANAGWLGRFKYALLAIAGINPDGKISTADENTVGDIVACLRYDEERVRLGWPENFLKGRRVHCEGMPGKSRAGGNVTNKKWSPVSTVPA